MALKEFEIRNSTASSIALREKIAGCHQNLQLCCEILQEYEAALDYIKKYQNIYSNNLWIQKDIERIQHKLKTQNVEREKNDRK